MPRNNNTNILYTYARVALCLLCVLLLPACDRLTVYYHYEHPSIDGWERNDTLNFHTEAVRKTGHYVEEIGLRTNEWYPFTALQLVIEQTVMPQGKTYCDTIKCKLYDDYAHNLGHGISNHQYLFRLRTLTLDENEHIHIAIRHDMKREILPGISDIGIRLRLAEDSDQHQYAGR